MDGPGASLLGLSVGLIQQDMSPAERRQNYGCDVTYATNSELGFDYLRDNMATDISEVVQREFQYCVIDEVDSILVDEARTPLIISGQVERPQEKYNQAAALALQLDRAAEMSKDGIDPEGDYEVDEKQRSVILTDEGYAKAESILGVEDLFNAADPWAHYVTNALKAKELFIKDVNYITRDNEVVIVDEFTGRVMSGRRWSDGLHQAVEAKESLPIQPETQTLASITYQNFFLLYPRLAGMTGTAKPRRWNSRRPTSWRSPSFPPTAPGPPGPGGSGLQNRIRQVARRRPGDRRGASHRASGVGGHHQRGEKRGALSPAAGRASPTTCSMPSLKTLSGRQRSLPRPAAPVR